MRVSAETRFAIIPEWVLFAPISPTAVRLYGVLARHADKEEHFSIVGRGKLAEQMRCAVDTIDRAMVELGEIGAVAVEHRTDPDNPLHLLPNRYVLAVAPPETPGRTSRARAATRRSAPTRAGAPRGKAAAEEPERVLGSRGRSGSSKPSQPPKAVDKRPRPPDPIFEALCELQGHGWADLNSTERGRLNKARILAAESKASPEAIREAARRWPDVMGDATLTAIGVMGNFHRLLSGPSRASRRPPDPPRPMTSGEMDQLIDRALGKDQP